MFKKVSKEIHALADPEKDCLPAPLLAESENHEDEWQDVAEVEGEQERLRPWSDRPRISGRAGLAWIERLALPVESAFNRLIGAQELNPFYHTGTLTVFLLIVVAVTGLYLTLFYMLPGLGASAAYDAVAAMDGHWFGIGRVMRGVHRYASGAAVITTLLHALRTLFQDRFRGARWLAWFTGMIMLGVLWLEGLSGYWLVWDTRAQLILDTVLRAIGIFPSVGVPYALDFITNEATARISVFFLLLLFVHVALFMVSGLLYWFHVLRLSRAKFLPPRYFMIAVGVILAAVSLWFPATSAARADMSRLPGPLTIDLFYLFYLPATLRVTPAFFWTATLVTFAFVTAIPWAFKGRLPGQVVIDKDICTGCTNCANDCPYNAIVMRPRTDGKPHKLVAIENPALCVSCGVCVGSCGGMAVGLTDLPVTPYYQSILARVRAASAAAGGPVRVVFTCERHGAHRRGEWRGLGDANHVSGRPSLIIFEAPCVAALHPNLLGQVIEAGAAEAVVIGCPPDDCAQREGNLWLEARLHRTRLPRLKKAYVEAPIRIALLPPNESGRALTAELPLPSYSAPKPNGKLPSLRPVHFLRGSLLLAALLIVQAAITNIPYRPFGPAESLLTLGMRNEGELRQQSEVLTGPELAELSHEEQVEYLNRQQAEGRFPTRLRLEIDGQVALDKSYPALGLRHEGSSFAYEKFFLPAGEHRIRLSMADAGSELKPVVEQTIEFAPGQIRALVFNRVTEAFEIK